MHNPPDHHDPLDDANDESERQSQRLDAEADEASVIAHESIEAIAHPKILRQIIRTDGTIEPLAGRRSLAELSALIGATVIDTVNLRHMGYPVHVMLVDDYGHVSIPVESASGVTLVPVAKRKPVNEKATALYLANCRPGTTHQIVGDVAIVPDDDFA